MEAGGPEIENMVFSDHPNDSTNKEGQKTQEDTKESEAAQVNGEAEKGNGVISNFISAFVSTRGKDDQEVEGVEEVSKSDAFLDENKVVKEGGLLDHLISMVTPNQDNYTQSEDGKGDLSSEVESGNNGLIVEEKDGGGGGVIHNLISNILHPSNGENSKTGKEEQVIEDGGGGDIDGNGDTHLPINVEDDRGTAPEIEEASMLIHSIVHD